MGQQHRGFSEGQPRVLRNWKEFSVAGGKSRSGRVFPKSSGDLHRTERVTIESTTGNTLSKSDGVVVVGKLFPGCVWVRTPFVLVLGRCFFNKRNELSSTGIVVQNVAKRLDFGPLLNGRRLSSRYMNRLPWWIIAVIARKNIKTIGSHNWNPYFSTKTTPKAGNSGKLLKNSLEVP